MRVENAHAWSHVSRVVLIQSKRIRGSVPGGGGWGVEARRTWGGRVGSCGEGGGGGGGGARTAARGERSRRWKRKAQRSASHEYELLKPPVERVSLLYARDNAGSRGLHAAGFPRSRS